MEQCAIPSAGINIWMKFDERGSRHHVHPSDSGIAIMMLRAKLEIDREIEE